MTTTELLPPPLPPPPFVSSLAIGTQPLAALNNNSLPPPGILSKSGLQASRGLSELLPGIQGFTFTAEDVSPSQRTAPDFSQLHRIAPPAVDVMPAAGDHPAPSACSSFLHSNHSSFYAGEMQINELPYGKSLAPAAGEGSDMHMLSIMSSDNNWDSIGFSSGENVEQRARLWIQKQGLNPAFQKGLVRQMRQMVNMKLITASVDIVDLL